MTATSISLAKLRSFIEVAEEKQFRKAAEKLGMSQPALSTQIRELEKSCGVPLLARTTRSVRLTVEGERFLRRAQKIVADLELAVADLREQAVLKHGHVTVAATPSVASNILPRGWPGLSSAIRA